MTNNIVFEYFTKEEIQMPFESVIQEKRAWGKYLLVLIRMKEQMLADSISFEELQNEYLLMKSFMEMRKRITQNKNPDKKNYAFGIMERLSLNEIEKMAFIMAWTQSDKAISSKQWGRFAESSKPEMVTLTVVQALKEFLELLEGHNLESIRTERLNLILENDIENIMIKEQEFRLGKIIQDYLENEMTVRQTGFGSVLDQFSYRILTGEEQELGQLVIYKELWEQLLRMVQNSGGLSAHHAQLRVHMVVGNMLRLYRSEGSQSHMKGDKGCVYALLTHLLEQFFCKMQSRCGSRCRPHLTAL